MTIAYEKRGYRDLAREGPPVRFEVRVRETDLWIRAPKDLAKESRELVLQYRSQLEGMIAKHPEFASSLGPWFPDGPCPPLCGKWPGQGPGQASAPWRRWRARSPNLWAGIF